MISTIRRKSALFLEYCRTHGIARSCLFVSRRIASRAKARLANLLLPNRLECPCCGWSGHLFDDYIEVGYRLDNYVCPRCGSQPRHRYFYLWLQRFYGLAGKTGLSIVFAFERPLARLWNDAKGLRTIRTDLACSLAVDVVANVEQLPFPGDCADLIWCHHVLEHVEDDRAAMRELCRVLRKSTGTLIVSVPMAESAKTLEYGRADPAESGHRRRYGDDFAERLAGAGFRCEAARMILPDPEMSRFGIFPDPYYICTRDADR